MKNYKADKPCVACGHYAENEVCFHHVNSQGSRGGDNEWNLMPLCKKCHILIHSIGRNSMSDRFSSVRAWLIEQGWEERMDSRWWHEK